MFGIADYGAFCAAVILFLAIPGPGNFALLSATGQAGLRGGLAATLGVILGDQVLMWCAVAGVAALMAAQPALFDAVRWAGAAYLAWIGFKLLRSKGDGSTSPVKLAPGHFLRQSLVITLLNPKAIVFYMAFFPLFIDPATHRGIPTFLAMAATIAALTFAYGLIVCALADRLARQLRQHPRLVVWLERLAGLCMIGFGLRLVRS
jgi:threonine/homoserine/homoserine lactone efflux protein